VRPSRIRALAALGVGVVMLCGCGATSQRDVLAQAGENLGKVRSGDMDLRMAVSSTDTAQAGQIGFEERGPFSLPAAGSLPVARTEVVHFVGTKQETQTFISTGKNAYIAAAGHTYALPAARVEQLRQASVTSGNASGLGNLQVNRWAAGGSTSDGGTVDGVGTDHVAATVNVVNFLNDVMQLSRGLGETASVPQLTDADAQELAKVVRSSKLELWAGKDDHLVRRLAVSVDFAAPSGSNPSEALAKYSRTRLDLSLVLGRVNQAVTVAEPADAQPFSAYCKQQPDAAACKAAQS
jgi:hypothetical protein